jgi:hypothetical protein
MAAKKLTYDEVRIKYDENNLYFPDQEYRGFQGVHKVMCLKKSCGKWLSVSLAQLKNRKNGCLSCRNGSIEN